MTAGSEDHRVRMDDVAGAVAQIETVRTEDDIVADEEFRDVGRIEDRDGQLRSSVHEGALNLEAGVVAGEGGAAERVCAEEALRNPAVLFAGEVHAITFQVANPLRGTLCDDLHRVRVGQ